MFPEPKQIKLIKEEHLAKYRGDSNTIWLRSSWEIRFFKWLMNNDSVKWVNSEDVIVWYYSPKDNKRHRYLMDFVFEFETKDNILRKVMVEVKPYYQCIPPKLTKTKTGRNHKKRLDRYKKEKLVYDINIAKWKAAKEFSVKNGLFFWILTEKPGDKWASEFKIWKAEDFIKEN